MCCACFWSDLTSGSSHCKCYREICQVSGRDAGVEDHYRELRRAAGGLEKVTEQQQNKWFGERAGNHLGRFLQDLGDNWLKWV